MIKRWMSLGLGVMAMGLSGCQSNELQAMDKGASSEQSVISGKVMYRERIALPDTAVLEVKLEDVSLADAPAKVLSEVELPTLGKQVPLTFTLSYDSEQIIDNHRYGLRIKIFDGERLLFTNDYHIGVINDPDTTDYVEAILKSAK